MAIFRRFLLALAAFGLLPGILLAAPAPAYAEKRVALVIGNDRYPNMPPERQLQKAGNDAEALGDELARLGFEVIRARDLGRQGMIDKLAEFTARLSPGDTAAFFYAGHGVAIGGVNYLVPSDVPRVTGDAETRVRGASIAEADIMAEIQARGARVALLVLDACRDNPFPGSGGRSIGSTRGLADAKPARGVFTIYSAGIGQEALDRLEPNDTNRNSVFTRVFVEQLAKPGLHLSDLAVEVREQVAALALKARNDLGQPAPHEQTPAYYDQTIGGRVYLAGRAIGIEPARQPPAESKIKEIEAKADQKPSGGEQVAARIEGVPAAATRTPRPRASGERCANLDRRTGADRYCVSSVLSSQFGNSYKVQNLFNDDASVAWVEGKPGQGIGEWIVVAFDAARLVSSFTIHNRYQKNSDIYYKNGRVRQLRLVFSGGETFSFNLEDRLGPQTLRLSRPVKAHWVQFVIDGVFAGRKYTDTAISKLRVSSEMAE